MIRYLFSLAVFLIPFTSLKGIRALGEIQHEASAYVFLLTLVLACASVIQVGPVQAVVDKRVTLLPQIAFGALFVIFISFLANFPTINISYFQGRWGMEKFASSTILVLYGFSLSFLTYYLAGKAQWDSLIVKPMMISVAVCAVYSVFELAAHAGIGTGFYQALSSLVHGDFRELKWDERLRSVAFEPPDFANTAGYIWPWLLGGVMSAKGGRSALVFGLWVVLNAMIVLSEARTSLVIISGLLMTFAALRYLFLPVVPPKNPEHFVTVVTTVVGIVLPILFFVIGVYFDQIVLSVVSGNNISNLSRLASMVAAINMFHAHPVFGLGFGQFGFHVMEFMPSWGYLSWEIQNWLFGPVGYWPAVYSVYARFAADMGILGPVGWVGLWLWLVRALLIETILYRKETGQIPFAAYPLIMSCACVLLAGIPCDSVRAPMIWINLGLVCRYLHEMRQARAAVPIASAA